MDGEGTSRQFVGTGHEQAYSLFSLRLHPQPREALLCADVLLKWLTLRLLDSLTVTLSRTIDMLKSLLSLMAERGSAPWRHNNTGEEMRKTGGNTPALSVPPKRKNEIPFLRPPPLGAFQSEAEVLTTRESLTRHRLNGGLSQNDKLG